MIASTGTGGTITGISKKLKELLPNLIVIGVDPYGSALAKTDQQDDLSVKLAIEGIGQKFVPRVLD